MAKTLLSFVPLLIAFSAFAEAEAPTEKADPLTIGIFLFLFFGGCVGYFVYMWWEQKKRKEQGVVVDKRH